MQNGTRGDAPNKSVPDYSLSCVELGPGAASLRCCTTPGERDRVLSGVRGTRFAIGFGARSPFCCRPLGATAAWFATLFLYLDTARTRFERCEILNNALFRPRIRELLSRFFSPTSASLSASRGTTNANNRVNRESPMTRQKYIYVSMPRLTITVGSKPNHTLYHPQLENHCSSGPRAVERIIIYVSIFTDFSFFVSFLFFEDSKRWIWRKRMWTQNWFFTMIPRWIFFFLQRWVSSCRQYFWIYHLCRRSNENGLDKMENEMECFNREIVIYIFYLHTLINEIVVFVLSIEICTKIYRTEWCFSNFINFWKDQQIFVEDKHWH